jgi:hypothetical protein
VGHLKDPRRFLDSIQALRAIAEPIGPLHSFWDVIGDMDAFRLGEPTIVSYTEEEWIEMAESLVKE